MDETQGRRILIAGGGLAGLAMGRALRQRGLASRTLERRHDLSDAGLAINLPGNAVRALGQLGLTDRLRAVGTPIRRREYRTQSGRLLFAVDEDTFWGAEARPHCLRRADLLRLLALDQPPGGLRRGSGVAAVHQDRQSVTVTLGDGSVEVGALLVGADGVHSAVRRGVFGTRGPAAAMLASASWRFLAPNPGIDAWTLWAGAGGLFLLIPVDRGEVYGWVSVGAGGNSDLAAARAVFDPFPLCVRETLEGVLARPGAVHHAPLEEVRIPSWTRERVILVGDAAHATAPVWAQGAALAFEDALVLADFLAERGDWSTVGPRYEASRRPRVDHVQAMTDRLSRTARLPDWVRNLLLPRIGPRSYRATYAPLRVPVSAAPHGVSGPA